MIDLLVKLPCSIYKPTKAIVIATYVMHFFYGQKYLNSLKFKNIGVFVWASQSILVSIHSNCTVLNSVGFSDLNMFHYIYNELNIFFMVESSPLLPIFFLKRIKMVLHSFSFCEFSFTSLVRKDGFRLHWNPLYNNAYTYCSHRISCDDALGSTDLRSIELTACYICFYFYLLMVNNFIWFCLPVFFSYMVEAVRMC